jgi:hypothetical protein
LEEETKREILNAALRNAGLRSGSGWPWGVLVEEAFLGLDLGIWYPCVWCWIR